MQDRFEQVRRLCAEDDYFWAEQTNLKNEADGLLASTYIPEFEDAVEGERFPGGFPSLWQWTSVPITVDHASGSGTLEGTGVFPDSGRGGE